MRHIRWKLIILIIILMFSRSSAFTEGLSGWVNIISNITKSFEDGEKISDVDNFNRNLYLKLDKSITPMLSYQINLRTNWLDSDVTDADDVTTTSYQRRLEPAMDFSLRNPTYDMTVGYRRQEQWSTAHLTNESRVTSEFYYSRFGLTPAIFPSLSFYFDRQEDFDYLTDKNTDRTNSTYSIISTYELPSRDLALRYNLNYLYNEDETPLNITEKIINNSFNGNYNIGYSGFSWSRKVSYSVGYQGNYSRNKNRQFVAQTGSVPIKRTTLDTLISNDATPDTDPLNSTAQSQLLKNGDFEDNTNIELNTTDQNIGILIIFDNVDKLNIYYGNDGLADSVTWRVYWSNNNQNWNFITETTVSPTFDSDNNVYRYVITFPATSAIYFKAVNLNTVPQVDGSDVEITEIEAYGTEEVPETNILTTVSTSFSQRLNLNTDVMPFTKLRFAFHYSLDRLDQNPLSLVDSTTGIFKNILSDSIEDEKEGFRSIITRNYGLATTWITHKLVTTTLRFQRNENFDNLEELDTESNTYLLSFAYVPLPTLDANLSLIKNERYNFNEKDTTDNSFLLSVGSKLHRDVNMITDVEYTQSKSFANDTRSSSYSINGSLDALVTRKLSGTLNYGFTRTSSDDTSSSSKDALVRIDYRPGRFINLSGNFSFLDSGENRTTSEGFLIDWLLLPAIRLNLNYQHSHSEPGPSKSDILNGYGIWYITKFADVRFSYGYTRSAEDNVIEGHNFSTNLNCRF